MSWRDKSVGKPQNLTEIKPLIKSASSNRYSRHFNSPKKSHPRPLTSRVLRGSTPCLSSNKESRASSGFQGQEDPRYKEDWITSMRVRLESLNLRSSDREEKPRTVSRPKGLSSVSSNSLSLLPLAREVANSSGKFNSNQCLSNGLRSTMGRAFRFNEDGFQKARNHPVMIEPQIKIAIEGDRMLSTEKGENFSGNFDNIERKNKSNVLNGKVLNQGKPRKVTSYQEDFGIKKLSTSNMRERISQPNGNGNEFECLASSREHYPTHSYDSNKTMQPVQKDKLTISKPTIQMSSLTTYRKNTDRPLNFMSLKPALRFNQQYRIPDQIDWI